MLKKVIYSIYRINFRSDLKMCSDILIWDKELSNNILLLFEDNKNIQILSRRQKIDVPSKFGFFFFFLKALIKGNFFPIPYYVAAYLSPKILITNIDNSLNYRIIRLLNANIRSISIQNGIRYDFMMENILEFELDIYIGFGKVEKYILDCAGVNVNHFYSTGALSLCNNKIYQNSHADKYDIIFISDIISADFHLNEHNQIYKNFYNQCEFYTKIICNMLDKLSMETGLGIAIAMRSNGEEPGHDIENSLYKPYNNLIMIEKNDKSSYHLCIKSNLIITIGSTLGYEMLGLNKKVLFCNGIEPISRSSFFSPFNSNFYNEFINEKSLIYDLDYDVFKEKIYNLLNMPIINYIDEIKLMRSFYMNFGGTENFQKVISDIKSELLNDKN